MEIIKETLWNRIFHREEIKKQLEEKHRQQHIIDVAGDFIKSLKESKDLTTILRIHKNIWGSGLRNRNIGPNPYGMFRTKNIGEMKAEEVMLGNIFGLFTYSIAVWEKNDSAKQPFGANDYGIDPASSVYDVIVWQYRNHLISNIKAIRAKAEEFIKQYNEKC